MRCPTHDRVLVFGTCPSCVSLTTILRDRLGNPVDDRGHLFEPGAVVDVVATGYGAQLWMTGTPATVVALGPKRARITHPAHIGTYKVHYRCLRLVSRAPLTERSRCGIHGDPTFSGRCATCDVAAKEASHD